MILHAAKHPVTLVEKKKRKEADILDNFTGAIVTKEFTFPYSERRQSAGKKAGTGQSVGETRPLPTSQAVVLLPAQAVLQGLEGRLDMCYRHPHLASGNKGSTHIPLAAPKQELKSQRPTSLHFSQDSSLAGFSNFFYLRTWTRKAQWLCSVLLPTENA